MNFEVDRHLGEAVRSVSSLERDGLPARAVTLTRSYATPVADLWDAVTNGERIPRWFAPVSGELRLGGRYQVEGNAGGTDHGVRATVTLRAQLGIRQGNELGGRERGG